MCGIVGLFLKNPELTPRLGELFSPMLVYMTSRGPDSAGVAIYGNPAPVGTIKLTLRHDRSDYDWAGLVATLNRRFATAAHLLVNRTYAVITIAAPEVALRQILNATDSKVRIMSVGRSIEIIKEMGTPPSIVERFGMSRMQGSHAIGHTRMATESAVTTDGSHPFSTGLDLCLVHNGSLSNHNRLRRLLQRHGIEFLTDNDSEVAAGYLMWRMREGATLKQTLESALRDLDGFYTFAIGTMSGFAVLRDPIGCKPAVLAETDDYVAMASEFQALAELPGIDRAAIWEPKPGVIYTWGDN